MNILLVDDDPDCRLFIREAIAESGYEYVVYEVTGGAEALDFLCRRGRHVDAPAIDLVYLDIDMPGMNGQAVLKAIRADRRFATIPVVMMTAVADDKEKLEAARNGANSYTVKPTSPAEFTKTVVEVTKYWAKIHQHPSCAFDAPGGKDGSR